jgi:hypothetical protein
MIQTLKTILFASVLTLGLIGQPQEAAANHDSTDILVVGLVSSATLLVLDVVSVIPSSIYLAEKKHSPLGWQVFGYASSGLTLGVGVTLAATGPSSWSVPWILIGSGAVTLTMAILAGTLNRSKEPTVALSPILLQDVSGNLTLGVGLSLLSF